MHKLLAAYRIDPSDRNARRLQTYLTKHPMSVCFLAPDEIAYLRKQGFSL